jgi:hypothetical protein
MKKFGLVLVLAAVAAGGIFGQEQEQEQLWGGKNNFVSVDLGLLVAGARYERLLTPKISVGVDAYWANSFIIFNELEAGLFGRFYIWRGLFAELGAGFHVHTGTEDYEYEGLDGKTNTGTAFVSTTGFAISPGLGWKFDPGKGGSFFVEPGISVPITIGKKTSASFGFESETGVSAGFILYCGLGWAF